MTTGKYLPTSKMAENRHFSEDDIHMAKMPMKKIFKLTYS